MTEWRDIPGYEGFYAASDRGEIMRTMSRTSGKAGTIRKTMPLNNGYLLMELSRKGEKRRYLVHQLVALAFLGEPADGLQINHINGIKTDNRLVNLEYVTAGDNQRHAYKIGLRSGDGVKNSQSKLTEDKVKRIRSRYAKGDITQRQLAEDYGLCQQTIGNVITRKSWDHVK